MNRYGLFNLFYHTGNDYQVYQDTILDTTITDFSDYSFAITENIFDTTGTIYFSDFLAVENITEDRIIYNKFLFSLKFYVSKFSYSGINSSFQSRITNDFINPSSIKGSSFANCSAANLVLKIAIFPLALSVKGPTPITS